MQGLRRWADVCRAWAIPCCQRVGTLLILTLSLLTMAGCIRDPYTRDLTVLSRRQATEDLDYLMANAKAIHPNLYHHTPQAVLEAKAKEIRDGLPPSISRREFTLRVRELLALVQDTHTNCNDEVDCVQAVTAGTARFLPLLVQFEAPDRLRIIGVAEKGHSPDLQPGCILTHIDEQPVADVIAHYQRYVSADSDILCRRCMTQSLYMLWWYEHPQQTSFKLQFIDAGGQSHSEVVEGMAAQVTQPSKGANPNPNPYSFSFYRHGTLCQLRVPSFDLHLEHIWRKTLDDLFAAMAHQGTRTLVVDLRDCPGGCEGLGKDLMARVVSRPCTMPSLRLRYSTALQRAFLIWGLKERGIPSWLYLDRLLRLEWFYPEKLDLSQLQGEYLVLDHQVIPPQPHPWAGDLVLLVNQGTFSLANDAAAFVQDNALGWVAGEQTAEPASGYTGLTPLYLPNSGLGCSVSCIRETRVSGKDDAEPVMPDLPLALNVPDTVLMDRIAEWLQTKTAPASRPATRAGTEKETRSDYR